MITAPRRYRHITPEDYLASDNDGQWWHEYVDGVVYPMPEKTVDQNLVRGGALTSIMKAAPNSVHVFGGDFKLRIKTSDRDRFYYPDLLVVARYVREDAYFTTDALLVVEVLSPETERLDRGEKFEAYRLLPSIQEYVLLSTDVQELEIFRRRTGWQRELFLGPSVVQLESIGLSTNVSNFYRQIRKPS